MSAFAAFEFNPGVTMGWLVIGVVCGWLAIKAMDSPSYGDIGDFILGGIGALVGGFAYSYFGAGWPSFVCALLAACVFVGGARTITSMRE